MSAIAAMIIAKPFFTNTNHVVKFVVTSDEAGKVRFAITTEVFTLLLTDLGDTTRSYSAAYDGDDDDKTAGKGHFTLTGSQHTDPGAATAQIHMDGIPKGEFTLEFRAKAAV